MRTRLDLLVELRFLPASGDRGAPPVIFMIEGHTDPASQPASREGTVACGWMDHDVSVVFLSFMLLLIVSSRKRQKHRIFASCSFRIKIRD